MFAHVAFSLLKKPKLSIISLLSVLSVICFHVAVGMRESVMLSIMNGASFIPFVKSYVTLPCTFLIGALYLTIQRRLGTARTYAVINFGLLTYFIIFTLLIMPNYDAWTPSAASIQYFQRQYPTLRFFLGIIAHWPSALFYVFAEIWSIYIFIILFWQVASETLSGEEASKYYPFVSFLISIGTTLASFPVQQMGQSLTPEHVLLAYLLPLSISVTGIVFYLDMRWGLERTKQRSRSNESDQLSTLKKIMKFFDNSLSQEVLRLAICLFSFNFLACLFENCFWSRVSQQLGSQQAILDFYSHYIFMKGLLSMLASLANIYLLRHTSWFFVLRITPVVCIVTVHLFFLCYLPQTLIVLPKLSIFSMPAPEIMTWCFAFALVLTYASKFSFFDPAKEILIAALPPEERRISKVFADGISGRAGKISGSIVQSILLSFTNAESILDIMPLLLIFAVSSSTVFASAIQKLHSSSVRYIKKPSQLKEAI